MKINLRAWCLGAALALMGSTVIPARADQWNKETRLEINEPLEIPGKVLTPGTYIFELADSQSDRNIVQVWSVDADGRRKFVTTVFTISDYDLKTPDKTIIRLEERPSGSPQAVHSWFYPGENTGWQFVYPKSESFQLAADSVVAEPPAPVAAAPILPDPPADTVVQEPPAEPALVELALVEEEPLVLVPDETGEPETAYDPILPETAGHSITELAAGFATLGLGLLTVFAGRRRAEA
jgi:hypothetical protein